MVAMEEAMEEMEDTEEDFSISWVKPD